MRPIVALILLALPVAIAASAAQAHSGARDGRGAAPIAVTANGDASARVLRAERVEFEPDRDEAHEHDQRAFRLPPQRRKDARGTRWIEFQ